MRGTMAATLGTAATALIVGPAIGSGGPTEASAQVSFSVTPEQLEINQRISQAAVRRANESLGLLAPVRGEGAPGWPTARIADGAVTGGKLAGGAVGTAQLADRAVAGAKLDTGAVGAAQLADGAVTEQRLDTALQGRFPCSRSSEPVASSPQDAAQPPRTGPPSGPTACPSIET